MLEDNEIHNSYKSLYEELLHGEIRANDDFRILQYECAIRSVVEQLNIIINANPLKPELIKDTIMEVYRAGICTYIEEPCSFTYWNEETSELEYEDGYDRFIWLDRLYLDYPFLDEIKYYDHPRFNTNEYEDYDYEIDPLNLNPPAPSRLNKSSRKSGRIKLSIEKGLLAWIDDGSVDKKTFLKFLPSVLDADKKDIEKNIEKIIDMFYSYDQYTFFKQPIKDIKPIYNENQSESQIRKWIKRIEELIKTYGDYQFKNR